MAKFDSNLAWKDASALVRGNRDVLAALAGVFMVVPAFALAVLKPPPEPATGADPAAMMAVMGEYYTQVWPALLIIGLMSILGTLAALALFTDRTRPTVGEAIRLGVAGLGTVVASQLIIVFGVGLVSGVLIALARASGVTALTTLIMAGLIGIMIYVMVRLSLISPVVMVEGQRNPVAALKRSWRLTGGSTLQLLVFYALLLIACIVIYWIASMLIGLIIGLVLSGTAAVIANTLVATVLQAAISILFIAVAAASHRQLAGAQPDRAATVAE